MSGARDDDDHSTQFTNLETEQRAPSPRVKRLSRIVVVEGRDRHKCLDIDPNALQRLLVGTSPVCDLILTDPTVSRRHLAIESEGARHRLRDLGSTNGTYVEGVAVIEGFVRGGETVRLGDTALRLESEHAIAAWLPERDRFGRVVGASPPMRRLYVLAERLARLDVPLLIEGPLGVGKELLAEAIHEASSRVHAPFIVMDCRAIPPNELEAELVGDDRPDRQRPGALEEAAGGTLVIDEIGHLDIPTQGKLLRLLERGEVRRIGSVRTVGLSTRIMATTSRDLDRDVAAGRFREELLRQLAVGRIELPPLAARPGDVELLTRHFVTALGAAPDLLTEDVVSRLIDYPWPGNVAELKDAIARLVATGEGGATFDPRLLVDGKGALRPVDWLDAAIDAEPRFPLLRRRVLEAFEERFVTRLLAAHGGSLTRAAAASGVALRYFRMIKSRQVKRV